MHILLTAFWATIYEPFIHGYNLEQLESHCKLVCKLFGCTAYLDFLPPEGPFSQKGLFNGF